MYKLFVKSLNEWNATKDSLAKLQGAYIAVAVIALVVAGIVGLIRYDAGQLILSISLIALAAFFVNLIAWALLQGLVLFRLDKSEAKPTIRKI